MKGISSLGTVMADGFHKLAGHQHAGIGDMHVDRRRKEKDRKHRKAVKRRKAAERKSK